jgi:hypothetical protein
MGSLHTAWSRKEWERTQADGENMPAAELTLFITTWVCVIASVHNFIAFIAFPDKHFCTCMLFHDLECR